MTATAYAGKGLSPRQRVSGQPFTVEHFGRWAARFKLKDGSRFTLEPYQAAFLGDLFAREPDGRPRYAELWLVVPEGNGKTTFFALVVLYTIEFTPEAWVPVAASARDQAVDLTYRLAAGFVVRNQFENEFQLHPGYRQVVHRRSAGSAKIFASDAASGDGVDPTLAVIEELHRLVKMDLYETWAGKLDKSGGQLVVVSTAGEPGGAFEELREQIRQSAVELERDGCFVRAVSAGCVLHEYALPENGDIEDIALVKAANPFSQITVESLMKKRARTRNLAHWRRFTCNLPTRAETAAIQEPDWFGAATEERIPEGVTVMLGIDVGWKFDTTALVPLWVRDPEFRLLGAATILEPPRDGTWIDPDLIKHAVLQVQKRNPIGLVVMDTSNAIDVAAWIESELGLTVVDRAQTNTLAVLDYQRFTEGLRQGWLKHSGDPGLTKHVLNAKAKLLPGGDFRFDRPHPSRLGSKQDMRVIDALTAAAMVNCIASESAPEPLIAFA